MQIEIPDELNTRLQYIAKGKGQAVGEFVCEAIEARLAMEEQIAQSLEGWTQEELRAALQTGLNSGPGRPFDESLVEAIKARGRERLAAQQRDKT